jgi:transcriptional regulator with XRE-family HTH domain
MTMAADAPAIFGLELRRQRLRAGLSLADLARLVHYSKSHLSKVETGAKPASSDLARRCDAALSTSGGLLALAPSHGERQTASTLSPSDSALTTTLEAPRDIAVGYVGRRSVLAGGAAVAAAWSSAGGLSHLLAGGSRVQAVQPTLTAVRAIFDRLRQLGQWVSPALLLPQVAANVYALRALAGHVPGSQSGQVAALASRFAEYAGWLAQEAGDDHSALGWTDQAVELAATAKDRDMAAYAYVRRGLIALYQHDAASTVLLARAAQSATADRRILGLASQREAQGHALAGDYDACMRAIDVASVHLSRADSAADPVTGSANVADIAAIAEGWCLFDLGRPARAAAILQAELRRIPAEALRARARYGTRLALACAASGEAEAAGAAIAPVLDTVEQIGSATVRADMRQLARSLNRFHGLPAIRDTRLRLTEVLTLSGYQ